MSANPLAAAALFQAPDWLPLIDELQDRGCEPHSFGIAKSVAETVPDFDLQLRDVIDSALGLGAPGSVLEAMAGLFPQHYVVFGISGNDDRVFLQERLSGVLREYEHFVDQTVDPSLFCPLGHPMPGINREDTLSHFLRASMSADIDAAASAFERTLDQYFAVEPPMRRRWLDLRYSGMASDSDGYRLQAAFDLGGRYLRLCTMRCGFLHYRARWFASTNTGSGHTGSARS